MSRTKTIYFLSAFVLIIGCFALNKSYSLFVDSEEKEIVSSTVPSLDVTLSMDSITVEAGKEYLIKQTVTNNSVVPVNFGIKTNSTSTNYTVQVANDGTDTNLSYGTVDAKVSETESSYKDVYLVVKNTNTDTYTEPITINFELKYNYSTLNYDVADVTNINNEKYDVSAISIPYGDKSNTLTNKILLNFVNSDIYTGTKTTTVTTELTNLFSNETDKIAIPVTIKSENQLEVPNPTSFTGVETSEVGLYKAEDDYGTSYYYRGASSSNYVNFAGFTWRIVRINGNGSVRLILDGTLDKVIRDGESSVVGVGSEFQRYPYNDNAYVGYMYGFAGLKGNICIKTADDGTKILGTEIETEDTCTSAGGVWTSPYDATHININDSTIKTNIDTFYEEYIENDEKNYHFEKYLADTIFCGDKSLASSTIGSSNPVLGYGINNAYYSATERLVYSTGTNITTEAKPTLKCDNSSLSPYSRYSVEAKTFNEINTNGDLTYPIALLSADEVVFAGGFILTSNNLFYLYDSNKSIISEDGWWTMSPSMYNGTSNGNGAVFIGAGSAYSLISGSVYSGGSSTISDLGIRPVINLSADVLWAGGDGTNEGPYEVSLPITE